MFSRYFGIISVVLALLALPMGVGAQDTPIVYGDIVTGEITNRNFEVGYVFTGSQSDIIVIEMRGIELEGVAEALDNPMIMLLNSDYEVLASITSYYMATLAIQLPDDGEYTVLASRRDGRGGDALGGFRLRLLLPHVFVADEPVVTTMGSDYIDYYIAQSDDPFAIEYEKYSGDLFPEISIQSINSDYGLRSLAVLSGDALESGALSVQHPPEQSVFVVVVSAYSYRETVMEYALTMVMKDETGE